jgi:formate hydrogenlyase subunit 3/multisubunit Na+/H+ antiporter MnhD subunit
MLIGVIMALLQEDLKRLLAYHSISQMGYIILGFGMATPLGIYGALFHIMNHMLFKGCLFLITGALILRVNTRQIHRMGGLIKQMPLTAISFLVASLAMSGIPLLNGFVSKELIYEGSIQAGYPVLINIPGMNLTIFGIIGWITSLMTFICLIHAFYVIFLGKPKDELKDVKDPPLYMMIPILLMATLCIVIGLFPGLVSGALQYAAAVLYGIRI